ncbi:hypothetical protein [Shinella sp.]|uniref:hypothetical protein n=1 Tax=Shinella sp. TaxID=1870904 RepID=UPI0039E56991
MRHNERAVPKTQQRPADPSEIRPKLRFLLSDEAREEGKMMVRNFRGYTLSRPSDDTRCQFESIARGIREERWPNIAAADEIMDGVLLASVEKIASGFRQPEWMLWRSSWANALADGWPNRMEGAANRMMTRDERFLPSMIDDETAMLPRTTVDAVYAGSGIRRGVAPVLPNRRQALEPDKLEAARIWYRDVFMRIDDPAKRRAAVRTMSLEQERAYLDGFQEEQRLKDTAKVMISEIERVTGYKFERVWKTKDQLHVALRTHFEEAGFTEKLSMRKLKLGAY